MTRPSRIFVALAATIAPALAQSPTDAPASYTFREAPFNARGVTSLDALRGKPVIVEFWGTR